MQRVILSKAVAASPLRFAALVGSSNVWIAMGQYFASNFTFFFCLTWLFPYLQRTYGLQAMQALCHEFDLRGIRYEKQVKVPVVYKGKVIGETRIDLLVEGCVIVELKACDAEHRITKKRISQHHNVQSC